MQHQFRAKFRGITTLKMASQQTIPCLLWLTVYILLWVTQDVAGRTVGPIDNVRTGSPSQRRMRPRARLARDLHANLTTLERPEWMRLNVTLSVSSLSLDFVEGSSILCSILLMQIFFTLSVDFLSSNCSIVSHSPDFF